MDNTFICIEDDKGPDEFKQAGQQGRLQSNSSIGWIDLSAEDFSYLRNNVEYKIKPDIEIDNINKMSQLEMARLWRNAPSGHPYFDTSKHYHQIFKKRFEQLGGFTPSISKQIGWK
ncbi:MAG: hypothetical protein ACI88H_002821 [Cocleimonas sp.]|jgi:hypothetical protein